VVKEALEKLTAMALVVGFTGISFYAGMKFQLWLLTLK
jgi:hypothetical protein